MNLSIYKTISSISLSNGKNLVLFSSYPETGIKYPEISGKELFLLDEDGEIIWNVAVPIGSETQGIDGRPKEKFGLVGDDGFINLFEENGKFFLRSFFDMIFEVDIETGKATFQRWTR